jgi:hypothetical protein
MRVLKAVGPEGSVLTFNIPNHASEVTIGAFFEAHIAYYSMMQAIKNEAEGKQGELPMHLYLNALAWSLRPYMDGKNPLDVVLVGESETDIAAMLMGAVEGIANCMVKYEAKAPENSFEFGGKTWYLCEQAVNYRNKNGAGFSVKQVAQSLLLEEYYNNFLEFKLAKEVERVIEERAAINASELYMTPTRIFLAQMALFLRNDPHEALPTTQEAFDHWHAARITEIEQMPLSVALDIRNFFFLTSLPSAATPSSATGSSPQSPRPSKKAPSKSASGTGGKGTKKAKGASLEFMAAFGKQGRGKRGK